jgi:ankyrin repeat protein
MHSEITNFTNFTNFLTKIIFEDKLKEINPCLFTEENLKQQDEEGNTALHLLAFNKKIESIDSNLITSNLLNIENKRGTTALELIARGEQLNHLLPEEIAKTNISNRTIMLAAKAGHLGKLPIEHTTPEKLSIQEQGSKWTPYHYAATYGQLTKLPAHSHNLGTIKTIKDATDRTPWDYMKEDERIKYTLILVKNKLGHKPQAPTV